MELIVESKANGISRNRTCELLEIDPHRVREWVTRPTLVDTKPGPLHAPHALLPEERSAIIAVSKDELYVDDSHRVLAAKCADADIFSVSASTVYRVMLSQGLTTDRSGRSHHKGNSRKPDRPELTGPNQRWCWDISYLKTMVAGKFLFLFALLDEYSRKIVAFRISWNIVNAEGIELIDEGIEKEMLTPEQVSKLVLINDRGTQMKAVEFKRYLKEMGITQVFARPRTPNDNPFIESLFSTVKGAPSYPDAFIDEVDALAYFVPYVDFYNNVRLHGKIGYVTPAQRHRGEDKAILALRKQRHEEICKRRLVVNRATNNIIVKGERLINQNQLKLTNALA
jgi:putative transposase